MPLISQSKVFNFHLLCQLTSAQAPHTGALASGPAPGGFPWMLSAWQGSCSTAHGLEALQSSTWERRQERKWEERGDWGVRRGKRNKIWRGRCRIYGGMSEPVWPCLYVRSSFFGSFQVAAGPSQRCFSAINRAPHLFLSFQPRFKVPEGAVKLEPAQVYKCKILQ